MRKMVREWFEEQPEPWRSVLLESGKDSLDLYCNSLDDAIDDSISWAETQEGDDFWVDVYSLLVGGKCLKDISPHESWVKNAEPDVDQEAFERSPQMKIEIEIPDGWEVCGFLDGSDYVHVETPWGDECFYVRKKPDPFAKYIADVEALGLADGWVAIDEDGEAYYSKEKPVASESIPYWTVRSSEVANKQMPLAVACYAFSKPVPTFNGNWRESLLHIEGGKVFRDGGEG